MKNIITVSIEFYFKGKKFTPAITLELDSRMQSSGHIPVLYPLIATQNDIDLYSYEYEMMQTEAIKVSHAEGLVAGYIVNGTLDIAAFELAWREQQIRAAIRHIIEKKGLVHVLDEYPEIEQALIEIYNAGEDKNNNQG